MSRYAYIYEEHLSTSHYAGMSCGSLYILIWLYAQCGDHKNSHGLSLGGICCKYPTLRTQETKHFLKKSPWRTSLLWLDTQALKPWISVLDDQYFLTKNMRSDMLSSREVFAGSYLRVTVAFPKNQLMG